VAAVATGAESSREEPGLPPAPPRELWKKTRVPPPPVPPAASLPPVTTDMSPSAGAQVQPGGGAGGAPGAATTAGPAAACEGLGHLLRAPRAPGRRLLWERGGRGFCLLINKRKLLRAQAPLVECMNPLLKQAPNS
jgi:hypothetical protein